MLNHYMTKLVPIGGQQHLRYVDALTDSRLPTDIPKTMTDFLSLPVEIRRMIYIHALVVGFIYPYFETQKRDFPCYLGHFEPSQFGDSHNQERYQLPNVHLLQSCRLVYGEASPILYAKNHVLLPTLDLTLKFFTRCLTRLNAAHGSSP
ncbi:hypothetical protein MMC34_000355 [Xylographa carneopallida]|nr:hypothetical protein [Xylographa carneopallida]